MKYVQTEVVSLPGVFVTFYLDVPLFCMSDLLSLFFRSHTLITLTTPVTSCYLFSFSAQFGVGGGATLNIGLDGRDRGQRTAES